MLAALDSLHFEHHFSKLSGLFYTRVAPAFLPDPILVDVSPQACSLIGADPASFSSENVRQLLSGAKPASHGNTLAAVYSGHQFGVWAGQLGDGRALLLGDVAQISPQIDRFNPAGRLELALKGAGPTPYSRGGDGRAVLRSSIREYLCSEAMAGLGIPTSRALCIYHSPLPVWRETQETAAVVTRMAPTFVRFGSFEHWSYGNQHDALKELADYVINTFYPDLADLPPTARLLALIKAVAQRTAGLVAQWQAVGFMHGVLNTDNMSIIGLTLDYGPFGFMESYDPNTICNHTDRGGRYAYQRQPEIGLWNCHALARALLPLTSDVPGSQEALAAYATTFDTIMPELARRKLGLMTAHDDDRRLYNQLLDLMADSRVDYTQFFRSLADLPGNSSAAVPSTLRNEFIDLAGFDRWVAAYRERLKQEQSRDVQRQIAMRATNPMYVLRNHLAHTAILSAQQGDYSEVARLRQLLSQSFEEQPGCAHYAGRAPDWAAGLEVSCSS